MTTHYQHATVFKPLCNTRGASGTISTVPLAVDCKRCLKLMQSGAMQAGSVAGIDTARGPDVTAVVIAQRTDEGLGVLSSSVISRTGLTQMLKEQKVRVTRAVIRQYSEYTNMPLDAEWVETVIFKGSAAAFDIWCKTTGGPLPTDKVERVQKGFDFSTKKHTGFDDLTGCNREPMVSTRASRDTEAFIARVLAS